MTRRADKSLLVLALELPTGLPLGVRESSDLRPQARAAHDLRNGRELVEQLPELTRNDYRRLHAGERARNQDSSLVGEVKFLEWSPAGGLRHATLQRVTRA